jgi:recombinational DNA repair protein (RecF pathway)
MTERDRDDIQSDACARCGAPVESVGIERAYAYGLSEVLCFECARTLGGVYDAETETWAKEPDLRGLPDERR